MKSKGEKKLGKGGGQEVCTKALRHEGVCHVSQTERRSIQLRSKERGKGCHEVRLEGKMQEFAPASPSQPQRNAFSYVHLRNV